MTKMEDGKVALEAILTRIHDFGGIQRLGCRFRTEREHYFFDAGTGKVENLSDEEAVFFDWLFERGKRDGFEQWKKYNDGDSADEMLIELRKDIMRENLLQSPLLSHLRSREHQENLADSLKDHVRMITLELTGRCNLRCGYCIYNEDFCENRNFTENDMTEETAIKAIDYLAAHSGKEVAVTFYGGEPLLKYDLIEKCVKHAQKVMEGKELGFSMTSNMTLMTKERAEFFYRTANFSLVVSLDGPEEIHNAYRKYPNGIGSFQDTIRGLRILREVFGDSFASRVSLSMVFAPPYTYEHLEKINRFFQELDWLPQKTEKLLSYPENGSVQYSLEESEGVSYNESNDRGYVDTICRWTQKGDEMGDDAPENLSTRKFYDEILLRIHKRALTDKPTELFGLNGSCVPGTRRLYVTTDGYFKPCERMGLCPDIGSVETGLEYEKIKKLYVDDYIMASDEECTNCWAKRMCGVCYAKAYSEKGVDTEKKKYMCDMARHTAREGLILYHTQLERDPESLRHLNQIQYG